MSSNSHNRPHIHVPTNIAGGSRSERYPPELVAWTNEYLSSPDRASLSDTASGSRRVRSALVSQPMRLIETGSTNLNRASSFGTQHRYTRSDLGPQPQSSADTLQEPRVASRSSWRSESSYNYNAYDDDQSVDSSAGEMSRELASLSLNSEEGLHLFQSGLLNDRDEEWHRLVPQEAQAALGKREVERQSTIFEVFKSEKDYTFDLASVEEVFIVPLQTAHPPVIDPARLNGFIQEVFWNFSSLLRHHQRMLASLFNRQRDQHPIIQSISDIILDYVLQFKDDYESYIKHYPIAEARHRAELRKNPAYQAFLQSCSQNPRLRKRDLVTFLSRPVTRLPRLSLLLSHVHKLTDVESPDIEELPFILGILSEFIKSTQPGIIAAESQVKFWEFAESLVYMKGEIVEMDLFDESRSLIYSGELARRQRSDLEWHGWTDLDVTLLDNYFVLTLLEKRKDVSKRLITSRPIPLEFLRLGDFSAPSDTRKEREGIMGSLGLRSRDVYPFTVYHASAKSARRYTLYANSLAIRTAWKNALDEAIALRTYRQDANMWFVPQTINNDFFRISGNSRIQNALPLTGRVIAAVPFSSGGRSFLAVACSAGIFVSLRNKSEFRRVLPFTSVQTILALQWHNKFIVHHGSSLYSYSLDLLARTSQGLSTSSTLEASLERLVGSDNGSVLFCRSARIDSRTLVIFASKKLLQVTVHTLEAIRASTSSGPGNATSLRNTLSFRQYGPPLYIPKDAYDFVSLSKTIGITTEKGIIIVDATSDSKNVVSIVPDWKDYSQSPPIVNLKLRCEAAVPLGLIRFNPTELLVVYDTLGCFVTKHGIPTRQAAYVRWETKAQSYAHKGAHILLFSPEFIEVRSIASGSLVQVISGSEIRLLHYNSTTSSPESDLILMAIDGGAGMVTDTIAELVQTAEIPQSPQVSTDMMFDGWDM